MFLALMHCVNPLTIQFRARTPAVCSVPSACFQVPLALLPLRPHTSIVYPREWRESPAPSRVRNLPQRCGGDGKTADGVWNTEQVNDGDNGERRNLGHSRPFQLVESGRAVKDQVCWRSVRDAFACVCACVQCTCVEVLFKKGKEQRGNLLGV